MGGVTKLSDSSLFMSVCTCRFLWTNLKLRYSVCYTRVIQVQKPPASSYITKTRKSFLDLTLTCVFEITRASVLTPHLSLIKQRQLTNLASSNLSRCLSLTCPSHLSVSHLTEERENLGRSWLTPSPLTCLNVCLSPVCAQMDEIKLKDRAVSVLDKALGLQAGHAHRLQLQTQAAEQQIAALRDAQRVGLNHPTLNPNPNNAPHIVSSASSCLFKLHVKKPSHLLHVTEAPEHYSGSSCLCCATDSRLINCVTLSCVPGTSLHQCRNKADSATTGTEPVVMAAIYDCDFSDTSLLYSPNIHSTTDQAAAVKDRIIPTEQLDAARDQLFTES